MHNRAIFDLALHNGILVGTQQMSAVISNLLRPPNDLPKEFRRNYVIGIIGYPVGNSYWQLIRAGKGRGKVHVFSMVEPTAISD